MRFIKKQKILTWLVSVCVLSRITQLHQIWFSQLLHLHPWQIWGFFLKWQIRWIVSLNRVKAWGRIMMRFPVGHFDASYQHILEYKHHNNEIANMARFFSSHTTCKCKTDFAQTSTSPVDLPWNQINRGLWPHLVAFATWEESPRGGRFKSVWYQPRRHQWNIPSLKMERAQKTAPGLPCPPTSRHTRPITPQ